jgi:hypothetical protein
VSSLSTPFNYKRTSKSAFEFTTENGVRYRVSFSDGTEYFTRHPEFSNKVRTFQFLVLENPNVQLPQDDRVGVTICYIILQFFEQDPGGILFFIHDGSDGKQMGRRRKFDAWFRKFSSDRVLKKNDEIVVGRVKIFVSILLRTDHPMRDKITQAFDQLVLDATTKPDDEA